MAQDDPVTDLLVKALADPDETTSFPNGVAERVSLGGVSVTRATMEPDWHWATDESDLVGEDRCPKSHHVYVVSGTLGLELADGTTAEVGPGEAVAIPPGHDGWTVGDEQLVYVDFDARG